MSDRLQDQLNKTFEFALKYELSVEDTSALLDEVEAVINGGDWPTIGLYRKYLTEHWAAIGAMGDEIINKLSLGATDER